VLAAREVITPPASSQKRQPQLEVFSLFSLATNFSTARGTGSYPCARDTGWGSTPVLAAQEPAGRGDRSSRVRISFGRPQGSGAAQARPGRDAGAREGAGFLRPKSDAEGWGGVAEEPLQARPPGGTAPRPGGEAGNEALGVARLRAQSRKSVEDERIVKQGTARVERIESDRDAQLRHYTGLPPSTWTPWNPGSATASTGCWT
jgi:hypothetical protein